MWIIESDSYALNDETDEEIYIQFDYGLFFVMHDGEEIESFYSASAAAKFLEDYVTELNAQDAGTEVKK